MCGKPATKCRGEKRLCAAHLRKDAESIKAAELKPAVLKLKSVDEVVTMALDLVPDANPPPTTRRAATSVLTAFRNTLLYIPVAARRTGLVDLGRTTVPKLDTSLSSVIAGAKDNKLIVLIENQIGPLAVRMKALQGMIAQYFIMRTPVADIEFVSSSNKLRSISTTSTIEDSVTDSSNINTNTTTYSGRKRCAIHTCLQILRGREELRTWETHMTTGAKRDDLADCFLQAASYLNKIY